MQTSYAETRDTLGAVLADHPEDPPDSLILKAAQAAIECAAVCSACADACLGEGDLEDLRSCIRLNLDCADICHATARVLGRRTASELSVAGALLNACAEVCQSCAEVCAQHEHPHCRACAAVCQACAQACRNAFPLAQPAVDLDS